MTYLVRQCVIWTKTEYSDNVECCIVAIIRAEVTKIEACSSGILTSVDDEADQIGIVTIA